MRHSLDEFLDEHHALSRRYFLGLGAAGIAALSQVPLRAAEPSDEARLQQAIAKLESYFTTQESFRDVSRGSPKPHSLPPEKMKEVGLTRDTWKLEVVSDPEKPAKLLSPLTKETDTALDFARLMEIAKTRSVRFPKVMTCLNIGCPLGMGIWEGVPLRDVLWLTQPQENLRRVFYYGYHNDKPKQIFQSSLPVGRILEDPFDLPPVILCYKLNGHWLTPQRGGPVRMLVPEAYGFKSVKWLTHVYLSNLSHANDTYAKGNNDLDSPLKTFAETLSIPTEVKPMDPIPVTGYTQVGISGLSKVQTWIQPDDEKWPDDDPWFQKAPWQDAKILGPPKIWGGAFPDDKMPSPTKGFDSDTGQPKQWPLLLAKAHWASLLPGLPEGKYTFRCRTIDSKGVGQPLPRPFRKSGRAAIEEVSITVKG